ncbi:MAG: hypothetical protein H7122_00445 [Chitinophagaceae bacterium]|nr:hypothetical protein [Chitinophagaceae bacterium]
MPLLFSECSEKKRHDPETKDLTILSENNPGLNQDSIDVGMKNCDPKPYFSEMFAAFMKAQDSLRRELSALDQYQVSHDTWTKDRIKAALLKNGFKVDSSLDFTEAKKRRFNIRWTASWKNNSDNVDLHYSVWHKGEIYDFVYSSKKFPN